MRLAISNIAWEIDADAAVAALLIRHGIDAIDIAPGKYFPTPGEAAESEILRVRHWWRERGIEITGMQALLFGTAGLNLFGPAETQAAMLDHLRAVCRIGGVLGATRLVFGSPKNRDCTGLAAETAHVIAVGFFRRLGEVAADAGVRVCLEPNPACYGSNFMLSSAETAAVVRAVDHPAIRMQLDTGAMTINAEDAWSVVSGAAGLIGHVHASEPHLVPLGDGATPHALVASALARYLPDAIVSIEMVATRSEPHLTAIDRAIGVAARAYRNPDLGPPR